MSTLRQYFLDELENPSVRSRPWAKGGGGVINLMPPWLFSPVSFLLFLTKIKGEADPSPWSATESINMWNCSFKNVKVLLSILETHYRGRGLGVLIIPHPGYFWPKCPIYSSWNNLWFSIQHLLLSDLDIQNHINSPPPPSNTLYLVNIFALISLIWKPPIGPLLTHFHCFTYSYKGHHRNDK